MQWYYILLHHWCILKPEVKFITFNSLAGTRGIDPIFLKSSNLEYSTNGYLEYSIVSGNQEEIVSDIEYHYGDKYFIVNIGDLIYKNEWLLRKSNNSYDLILPETKKFESRIYLTHEINLSIITDSFCIRYPSIYYIPRSDKYIYREENNKEYINDIEGIDARRHSQIDLTANPLKPNKTIELHGSTYINDTDADITLIEMCVTRGVLYAIVNNRILPEI